MQNDTQSSDLEIPSGFSVAVPSVEDTEIAYTINDPIIGEPLVVRVSKRGAPPWWADSVKVQKLIAAFQNQANIIQACISAGISRQQYESFSATHPGLSYIKDRCREVWGLQAKLTFGNGLKKDHWLAHAYMKTEEPDKYSEKHRPGSMLPGGSVATVTESAFMDAEGNVVMRKKTAELIENDPDLNNAA